MSQIKAIETIYKGYRFRSRLEARWAVFFDAAGIKYEYEPEGFEAEDGTKYLPDFYLPEYDWYVEVKPPRDGAIDDIRRACKFVGEKIKVLVALGNIPPKSDIDIYHYRAFYKNPLHDCVTCGSVCITPGSVADQDPYTSLEFATWLYVDWSRHTPFFDISENEILVATHDRALYMYNGFECTPYCDTFAYDDDAQRFINSCYDKARQARFEHGETPRI